MTGWFTNVANDESTTLAFECPTCSQCQAAPPSGQLVCCGVVHCCDPHAKLPRRRMLQAMKHHADLMRSLTGSRYTPSRDRPQVSQSTTNASQSVAP
jgi:hypothetical protein